MDFFQQLSEKLGDYNMLLSIRKSDNGKLTVSMTAKGFDKDGQLPSPVAATGTPKELDEEFIPCVFQAMEILGGAKAKMDYMNNFIEQKKKAKEEQIKGKAAVKKEDEASKTQVSLFNS